MQACLAAYYKNEKAASPAELKRKSEKNQLAAQAATKKKESDRKNRFCKNHQKEWGPLFHMFQSTLLYQG